MRQLLIILLFIAKTSFLQVSTDGPALNFEKEIEHVLLTIDNSKKSKLKIEVWEGDFSYPGKLKKSKFKENINYYYINDSVVLEQYAKNYYQEYWLIKNNNLLYFDTSTNKALDNLNNKHHSSKDSLNFKIIKGITYFDSIPYQVKYEYDTKKRILNYTYKTENGEHLSTYKYNSLDNYTIYNFTIYKNDSLLNSTQYITEQKDSINYSRKATKKKSTITINYKNVITADIENREYFYNNSGNLYKVLLSYNFDDHISTTIVELKIKYRKLRKKDRKKIEYKLN